MRRRCGKSTCALAHPSASDALDAETCELCRELPPLPEAESELIFRERERERKAPLICAREVELPSREPDTYALGFGEDGGESRLAESSRP